jgi:hypothetical protein
MSFIWKSIHGNKTLNMYSDIVKTWSSGKVSSRYVKVSGTEPYVSRKLSLVACENKFPNRNTKTSSYQNGQ